MDETEDIKWEIVASEILSFHWFSYHPTFVDLENKLYILLYLSVTKPRSGETQ